MTQLATNRIGDLVAQLLDRGYAQAASATLRAVASSVQSGVVAQRLNELDAEAARLASAGQTLNADNPVLRALLADLDTAMRANTVRVSDGASATQAAGVQAASTITPALAFPGMSIQQLQAAGVGWNRPDPEAVNALVGYLSGDGWRTEMAGYPASVLNGVLNTAVRGMVEGWSASKTAREVRRIAEGMPVHTANNLLRTVQLQSFRDANALQQQANLDILDGQIRIATLDGRTCLACIAEHGTRLPAGERVLDHHSGRCIGVPTVRGRARVVATGEAWFAALSADAQRAQAGDAAYDLLASGRAQLRDFVQPYTDRVFGAMQREASVKAILGRAS